MLKYLIFGLIVTLVAANNIAARSNIDGVERTDLRITTPFDLVRDSAYSQVIEELDEIMVTINNTRVAAGPIIAKVAMAFINKYKADQKRQSMITMIESQTQKVLDTLETIKKMLDEIHDQLTIEFNEIKFNQKYAAMQGVIVDINVYFDDFALHLIKYTDADELKVRLRKLTENLRYSQLDMKLVRMAIEEEAGGTDSLVFAYAKFLELNNAGIKTSPNQQIMFFYQNILMHAHRANVLMEICYELLGELENVNVDGDLNYVRGRLTLNHNNLSNGAKKAFKEFDQPRYQMTYADTLKDGTAIEDTNFFQMNRLWYTLFTTTKELGQMTGKNCMFTCNHYQKDNFKSPSCDGTVLKCKSYVDLISGVDLKELNNDNRLYSGYKVGKNWYGEVNGPGALVQLRGFLDDQEYRCSVCQCVCDNHRGSNSARYFYNKEISAPDGYVVTGVRFVKRRFDSLNKYVIFVQPEVSHLLDLARVNSSTTRWVDLPNSLSDSDLHKIGEPQNMEISVGNLTFSKKAYITGVKFNYENHIASFWRLFVQIIGREVVINSQQNVELGNRIEGQFSDGRAVSIYQTDENTDAGQNVSPAFDSRNVNLTDPMPIIGISFQYHNIAHEKRSLRLIYPQLRTDNFADVFA